MKENLIDLSNVDEIEVSRVDDNAVLNDEQLFDISDNIEHMDDVLSDGETDDEVTY